ncbi:TIGR03761 family integrating conjugative element protein [Vibrio tubiashii]|uniref:AcaB family transcriptional regulator n=1 Tax=Vibrio tubiashii TaxID=29498 RepID=UPI001EFD2FFA|nr:AcaB family transcriptional regulator [Vibrio tubiashii]MCG9576647.1 TIGR03761 family integrating conjugative element protein [Vibrio tubiashii]
MTNQATSQSHAFLESLILTSDSAPSALHEIVKKNQAAQTTHKKDEVRFSTGNSFNFKTQQCMRLFDGLERDESSNGKKFIPGFHHLDRAINTNVHAGYRQGCPIARWFLLKLEEKLDQVKIAIDTDHVTASEQMEIFVLQNQSYTFERTSDAVLGKRNLSFRSPHVRDLMLSMEKLESTIVLLDMLAKANPRNKAYHPMKAAALSNVRSFLHMFDQYKFTGATIIDFDEKNSRASEAFNQNKKLSLPDNFDEWWRNDVQQSVFYDKAPTLEEFKSARDERHSSVMNDVQKADEQALADRRGEEQS